MNFKKYIITASVGLLATFLPGCALDNPTKDIDVRKNEYFEYDVKKTINVDRPYRDPNVVYDDAVPNWANFNIKLDRVSISPPFDYHVLEDHYWEQQEPIVEIVKAGKYCPIKYYNVQYGRNQNSAYVELLFFNHSKEDLPLDQCQVGSIFFCGFNPAESLNFKEYEEVRNMPTVRTDEEINLGTRPYTVIDTYGEPDYDGIVDKNLHEMVYKTYDSVMTFYYLDGLGISGIRLDRLLN